MRTKIGACAILGLAALAVGVLYLRRHEPPSPARPKVDQRPVVLADLEAVRPAEKSRLGYVSSSVCAECHPQQHASWHASYHRTMTQLASPTAVLGDFDDVRVTANERRFEMRRKGDVCWVEMDNPEVPVGQMPRAEVPIVMTTGSHHMQVYWYVTGHGRTVGQLPLVFLRETEEWIPRDAAFLVPPSTAFSAETGRWNETCVACHATAGASRPQPGGWDTEVAEFGISCEACHGPGEAHVQFRRQAGPASTAAVDPIVNPARLTHQRTSEVCGQCHGVTTARNPVEFQESLQRGAAYRPGDALPDSRKLIRADAASRQFLAQYVETDVDEYFRDRFWPDGMIRISGRELNGLSESRCHQQGELSCISCHAMHQRPDDPRSAAEWANDQLGAGMGTDQACLQCHAAASYGPAHTHHKSTSPGARCYNCHMPHTTYGLLKAIRSHQISVPHITEDRQAGRPNACNLCHLDRTLAWSDQHLHDWFGSARATLDSDEKTLAASIVWLLRGDAGVRALAAWNMGWSAAQETSGTAWQAPFLIHALGDPYDAVRLIARRSLKTLPGFSQFEFDVFGTPDELATGQQEAYLVWANRPRNEPAATPHLMQDEQGRLDRSTLHRILQQRDHRPVNLVE